MGLMIGTAVVSLLARIESILLFITCACKEDAKKTEIQISESINFLIGLVITSQRQEI